jgi:hypothetical protein
MRHFKHSPDLCGALGELETAEMDEAMRENMLLFQ